MREVFASDNFELKDFIASHKDVPTGDLLKDLEKTSQIVQNELFELINGDLGHFQEVLKEVCKGNLEAINQFRQSYESEVKSNEKRYLSFKEYYAEANGKYQKLKYVQKKRDLSLRLLKARKYIKIFTERNHSTENSIYELEISVKNYNWILKFTTEFVDDLEGEGEGDLYKELSQYSERLQEIFEIHLNNYFSNYQEKFEAEKEAEVCLLLTLCEEMKMMNLFEASFKLSILYPNLESFFDSSIESSSIINFNFKKFINNVLKFINLLKINWDAKINQFYKEEHKFWTRTVLGPVLAWINEKCSNISEGVSVFNPINLEEFKTNFEEGLKFVSRIEEEFFVFENDLLFFRSHAAWIGFMKKWSLHQYYQIRIKQIISPIESVMAIDFEARDNGDKDKDLKQSQVQVLLDATLVTVNALKHLWTDEVILKPLIPKFLKITLQVFKRFIDYCTEKSLNHVNPKTFLIVSLRKQYNLEQFVLLIEENVKPNLLKHLNNLEELDLSEEILIKLKREISESISKWNSSIIYEIEKLYDQIINNETELFTNINLEALKLLFSYEVTKIETSNFSSSPRQLIQKILLKVNRKIFKLIDEENKKEIVEFQVQFLEKMKEIEVEAGELGYPELINEEFWIEIKSAIINLKTTINN